jgi:hypothetical protein
MKITGRWRNKQNEYNLGSVRRAIISLPTKKEQRQQSKQTESTNDADTSQRRHFNRRNGGTQNTELSAAMNKSVNINKTRNTFDFFVITTSTNEEV